VDYSKQTCGAKNLAFTGRESGLQPASALALEPKVQRKTGPSAADSRALLVAQPLPRKTIARYKAMKILIATDGSKYGTAALERGCDIAAHMPDSEVKVLTAYELRP
jgi:hypothetical protein